MKVKTFICLALLLVGLTSCVDDKYDMDNLDTEVELSTELVGPLAYSTLNLVDILNVDSLGDLDINIKGDTMYLQMTDSQYLGNELIDQLKVLPSTSFKLEVPIGLLSLLEPTDAEINSDLDLEFPEINTNENERLDSILMGESNIDIVVRFPRKMKEGSYIKLSFKEDELLLNPEIYPENAIEIDLTNIDEEHPIIETNINLYGSMLRLSGKNKIQINFTGYVSTESYMEIFDVFEITLDCTHMKPHITFINIGNARDIVENEKTIEFDYAREIYDAGMSLPFYDPEIFMTCENNIGVPARYYIDYVEGICSETGEVVRAQFGDEDNTSVVLKTPSYKEIKGLSHKELLNFDTKKLTKYSELTLNRANGHTDRLFKIKVDKLRYKYRIRSTEKNRDNVHFFFYDSDIETKEITKLPLWFEGDPMNEDKNFKLTRKDTLSLSVGSLSGLEEAGISENSKAILKFQYKNHLPLGVEAKVKFIDSNDREIILSSAKEFTIKAAEVDEYGNAIVAKEPKDMLMLVLTYSEIQQLFSQPVRVVLDYTLKNEERKNIFLKSTDWLYLKIMFHLDATATLDIKDMQSNDDSEYYPEDDYYAEYE